MKVCYNKFFKLLIDKEICKMEFARIAGISQNTMDRLSRNQNVSLDVLGKICCNLNCKIDDILEFMPEKKDLKKKLFEGYYMNNEKEKDFLECLLTTELDSEMFSDQISLLSRYLVYSNPGYYYNETYLTSFCSELINFQKFVRDKNNIFVGILRKLLILPMELDFQYLMDYFWKYSSKDDVLGINMPIDVKQICTNKIIIKCILVYDDNEYLFLRTYSGDVQCEDTQEEIKEKAGIELMKWIEGIYNGKRK